MTASDDHRGSVLVVGGGPAGLTCAYELLKAAPGQAVTVLEATSSLGGISRTVCFNGYRVDIGGHRFFTKVPQVERLWHELLADDFIRVQRLSRIYYRGRFFNYPLKIFNALWNMGFLESCRILASYARSRILPIKPEESFEDWVTNRFGRRLYNHFFRSYTEKVWGIPPSQIRADWAAQRIKNLSLGKAVLNAVSGLNNTTSLIEEFRYPRLGPGMMWERAADRISGMGGRITLDSPVIGLERDGNRILAARIMTADGPRRVVARHFVNSMDLRSLIGCIEPPPPAPVVEAAKRLRYRDFLIVALVLDRPDPFPDNWIYVHEPDVKVGRIQNFRAWSRDMVPNERQSLVGMEYFCQSGDSLWDQTDDDLRTLATRELAKLCLANDEDVVGAYVIRQPKAYPVYDTEYQAAVATISEWINSIHNLQTIGRNGLHRYNNQDHSMLTAMLAAKNILGEANDLWSINTERSYHEEIEREASGARSRRAA